jgi:hypothetical protein
MHRNIPSRQTRVDDLSSTAPYVPPRCFHTLFIFSALCDCQMRSNSIYLVLSVHMYYISCPVILMIHNWCLGTLQSSPDHNPIDRPSLV